MRKFAAVILALALIASAGAQDKVIKIGTLFPMTGPVATAGQRCQAAVETIVDIINGVYPDLDLPIAKKAGLLDGYRIELVKADHQGKPDVAKSEAERLYGQEGVFAVIGSYNSSASKPASAVAERLQKIFMCGASSSAALTERDLKYFFRLAPTDRIEAIEFAVAHDDGLRAHELDRAEIVLTGVSRTSKTPLSMYLASHGWLVANIPLVANTEPPPQLFLADPTRVFALTIEAERLALLRRVRLTRLGMSAPTDYAELDYIREELRHARDIFRRGGWGTIDVTSKSIEESASEIILLRRERTGAAR